MRKQVSGFTIVEIIVVVVVVGILASIATVSYSGFVNKGKKSSYESTAQQVRLKLGDYFTENNSYPVVTTANEGTKVTSICGAPPAGSPPVGSPLQAGDLYNKFCFDSYSAGTLTVFKYRSLASDGTTNCTVAPCPLYTMRIKAGAWGGVDGTEDVVITP